MSNTVEKALVLVGLHARLDAIERECDEGGKNAGGAGGDLCAIVLDEGVVRDVLAIGAGRRIGGGRRHLLAVAPASSGVRHDGRWCSWREQWR